MGRLMARYWDHIEDTVTKIVCNNVSRPVIDSEKRLYRFSASPPNWSSRRLGRVPVRMFCSLDDPVHDALHSAGTLLRHQQVIGAQECEARGLCQPPDDGAQREVRVQ